LECPAETLRITDHYFVRLIKRSFENPLIEKPFEISKASTSTATATKLVIQSRESTLRRHTTNFAALFSLR
jgi:hypothetical protein